MTHPVQRKEMEEVFALMGVALATLHEIERDFANSVLVGLTNRQRKKHDTVQDLLEARSKMTFGQLVGHMKEQWTLKPEVEFFIDTFLKERNAFIHGLTTLDGYNPRHKRQRARLRKRVETFIEMSLLARRIFRAANYASIDFAQWWLTQHGVEHEPLPRVESIEDDIDSFLEMLGDQREPEQL